MNIALVIDSLGSGGAQRQLVELSIALRESGFSAFVVAYNPDGFYKPHLRESGVKAYTAGCSKSRWDKINYVNTVFKKEKPQLVISFLKGPSVLCCVLRVFSLCQYGLIVSERHFEERISLSTIARLCFFLVANKIVCNSASQSALIKKVSINSKRIITIPNSVDTGRFSPLESTSAVKKPGFQFISIGNFTRNKNIGMLIDVVATHANEFRNLNCSFDWFGDKNNYSDVYDSASDHIRDLRVGDLIRIHEPRHDIHNVLREADALILCSKSEAMPNVVLEAMASGVPVLSTAVGDVRSMLGDAYRFIARQNSVDGMAEVILSFVRSPRRERDDLGKELRQRAIQLYSREAFAGRWIKVVEGVFEK